MPAPLRASHCVCLVCSSRDDPSELFEASMSMVQDANARENGKSALFCADFSSVWASPTDFEDMSGLFGNDGMKEFPESPTQIDTPRKSSFFTDHVHATQKGRLSTRTALSVFFYRRCSQFDNYT